MEALTTEFLMQTATNMPFLGWMIYQYHAQEKVNREQRSEMKEIRKESKQEERELRERYNKVIADLQLDRDQLVKDLSKKTDSLERSIGKIFAILEPMKEQIQEMKIKEKVREKMTT